MLLWLEHFHHIGWKLSDAQQNHLLSYVQSINKYYLNKHIYYQTTYQDSCLFEMFSKFSTTQCFAPSFFIPTTPKIKEVSSHMGSVSRSLKQKNLKVKPGNILYLDICRRSTLSNNERQLMRKGKTPGNFQLFFSVDFCTSSMQQKENFTKNSKLCN